jgi:signal transduction histidine kinase
MASELKWPARRFTWVDAAWVLFAAANLAAMVLVAEWETVPFHFIWVSLTVLYGFRVWKTGPTLWLLAAVMGFTGAALMIDYLRGAQPADELTEVPLMAAMFVAMVWHARRRLAMMQEVERVSEANLRLLQREQQFVQDASHELRTPITVALGHAELIQRTSVDPVTAEDASVVVEELTRLRRLADRLLVLASAEHPGFVHRKPIEIEPLLVDAIRRWGHVERRWGISVVDVTVDADRDRLALALDTLIENAVKHTGDTDSIELSVQRVGPNAVLTVADTGAGIAPEELDRIFDRFARADGSRSRTHDNGMGLGLAIVKAVAQAHGGAVRASGSPGHGARFEIVLPLSTKERRGDRPVMSTPLSSGQAR